MKRFLYLISCLASFSACSKVDLLNATITREGYHVVRDVAYGTHSRQAMDIYIPNHASHLPVIVFFYGGSWQKGSKEDYRFLGQAFAEKGFITAVADYRLYPEIKFPTFLEDGAKAVAYMHTHAKEYGGDSQHFYIAGHSAGAYMAMMLGADPHYLAQAGGNRSTIRGIIGISGPYDFLPLTDDNLKDIFSTADDAKTQPINHLIAPIPPVFLASGERDDIVDPRNSQRVAAKLIGMNSPVETHFYADTDHISIMLSLAQGFRSRTSLLEDMARFIKKQNN